jgi:hypothetical protein
MVSDEVWEAFVPLIELAQELGCNLDLGRGVEIHPCVVTFEVVAAKYSIAYATQSDLG